MKTEKLSAFKRRYSNGLLKFLAEEGDPEPELAKTIGRRALAIGLETLDLAKVHEEALAAIVSLNKTTKLGETMILRAARFFAEANRPIELTHRIAQEGRSELKAAVAELTQLTEKLTESNAELLKEINHRKEVEATLRASEQTSSQLLKKSLKLQEEMRMLSRRLLSVQEEERKRISRELHDIIAQSFTSITLQLAEMKSKTLSDTKEYHERIERTQRLLEESVDMVHRFARDLRPSLLDDLGLTPALESYLKEFREVSGIQVKFTTTDDVESLDIQKRTVFYRVAQEALNNVAQHAEASRVKVKIEQRGKEICMEISDNGKGFQVYNDILSGSESLGLLGMRERADMVGGCFSVDSIPGTGTTVSVKIPLLDSSPGKSRDRKNTKRTPKSQ